MARFLQVSMPDADYLVPIEVIARHRAAHYAFDYDGDIERSLAEETLPLFEESPYDATDWATNSMSWSDVKDHASMMPRKATPVDYETAWVNCAKRVVEI
jgi:hypothetical protein